MPKIRTRQLNSFWLRQRELGIKFPLGHADLFHKTLYSSIQPVTSWDHASSPATHGGVFNLEYSPDGSLLLAACEKKTILMFDPLRRKLIHTIDNAHSDCVNCVRFLDQRMFATCSDDSTVALWDARNLKQRIRTLQGHSNWVKNIEYSPKDSLLLTSGFDGSIYTWDINSFTENSILYTRVFHMNGLMRTRLSPDASKMLISTTSGYLIIIHNLKLSTLSQDLAGFRPNMYRLMQSSQTTIPNVANFTHLFSHTRQHNRVEFLTDFPTGHDAEIISSLQVHPQGWCALSRNVSNGEKSEWTCVHDIQEREVSNTPDQSKEEDETTSQFNDVSVDALNSLGSSDSAHSNRSSRTNWQAMSRWSSWSQSIYLRSDRNASRANRGTAEFGWSSDSSDSNVSVDREEARQENRDVYPAANNDTIHEEASSDHERDLEQDYRSPRPNSHLIGNIELHVNASDVWEGRVPIREVRLSGERNWRSRSSNNTVVIIGDRGRFPNQNRQCQQTMYAIPRNRTIHQNTPRLTHYIEEPNVGSGYIKELCFSADGRLICSPFGYGVRLLAFSSDCSELCNCVPPYNESVPLQELATNVSHSGIVVSTKFSPRHCLLVSGCLSGKVVWHEPVV